MAEKSTRQISSEIPQYLLGELLPTPSLALDPAAWLALKSDLLREAIEEGAKNLGWRAIEMRWLGARCAEGDPDAIAAAFGPQGALTLRAMKKIAQKEPRAFALHALRAKHDEDWETSLRQAPRKQAASGRGLDDEPDDDFGGDLAKRKKSAPTASQLATAQAKKAWGEAQDRFAEGFAIACHQKMESPAALSDKESMSAGLGNAAERWMSMAAWRNQRQLKAFVAEWALALACASENRPLAQEALKAGARGEGDFPSAQLWERRLGSRPPASIAIARLLEREIMGEDDERGWALLADLASCGVKADSIEAICMAGELAQAAGLEIRRMENLSPEGRAQKNERLCAAALLSFWESRSSWMKKIEVFLRPADAGREREAELCERLLADAQNAVIPAPFLIAALAPRVSKERLQAAGDDILMRWSALIGRQARSLGAESSFEDQEEWIERQRPYLGLSFRALEQSAWAIRENGGFSEGAIQKAVADEASRTGHGANAADEPLRLIGRRLAALDAQALRAVVEQSAAAHSPKESGEVASASRKKRARNRL